MKWTVTLLVSLCVQLLLVAPFSLYSSIRIPLRYIVLCPKGVGLEISGPCMHVLNKEYMCKRKSSLVRCPDFRGLIVHKHGIWGGMRCPVY